MINLVEIAVSANSCGGDGVCVSVAVATEACLLFFKMFYLSWN